MATIALTMLAETQQMRKGIDSVNSSLGLMGKTMTGVGRMVKGLAVGFVAFKAASLVTNSIKEASSAIAEQDKLLAQTQATLKSTGGAAGVTAKDILSLSNALERKSMIDQEQIQAGQNMLLTFTNIRNEAGKGNDIFNQTTQIMTDLSTAMGQSTKSSALQLGKALNDPIKGISALSRVGVSFTEDQKKQVAALVESGNTMKAQKVILAELNKEFGGSAKAAGDTFAGKVKHLKDVWDGFVESLVRKALPGLTKVVDFMSKNLPVAIAAGTKAFNQAKTALAPYVAQLVSAGASAGKSLLPALKSLATFVVGSVIPAIGSLVDFLVKYQAVVVPVAAGIAAMVVAFKTYQAVANAVKAVQAAWIVVQTALNVAMTANPIGLIVLALVGLAAALVVAYKRSETFRNIVDKTFSFLKGAVTTAIDFVKAHWKLILGILIGPIGIAAVAIIKNWDKIKSATKAAWNAVKGAVSAAIGAVKSVIVGGFNAYKAYISAAWNAVKTLTTAAWNAFKSIISSQISAAMHLVSGIKGKVTGALSGARDLLFNAGKDIIQGLISGIDSMIGAVTSKLHALTDMIPLHKGPPKKDKTLLYKAGRLIIKGLIKGFDEGRKGIKDSLGDATDFIEHFFDKTLDREKSALVKRMKAHKASSKAIAAAVKHLEQTNKSQTKNAIKGLSNETKALIKNAKKREDVYARLEKAQKRLADLKKASADYKASVVSGILDYTNITGLDSAFNSKSMLAALQARLEKVKQFAALIKQLVKSGLNATMVDQLVSAGVEGGLAYAQSIAAGGTDAITQFNDLQKQIDAAAGGLGTTAANSMYQSGIQAAQGLVDGLIAKKKDLEKVARRLAKDLIKAIKDELKIKSPSRVFKAIGEFTLAGLEQGLQDTRGITKAMTGVSNAMTTAVSSPAVAAPAAASAGTGSGHTYVTINVPESSDPIATARYLKKQLDKLPTHERRTITA